MVLIDSTTIDAVPNLNMMVRIVSVEPTADTDWVEMSTYGFTTVYMAIALDHVNVTEPCTISDSTKITLTAGASTGATGKILVMGV